MQRSALCRSRRELSNAYLLAKFGFDTAENEPCKVKPALRVQILIIITDPPGIAIVHEVRARTSAAYARTDESPSGAK